MKSHILFSSVLGAIALFSNLAATIPSHAEGEASFYCGTSEGSPATLAKTERGEVVIIRWVSEYFSESGYSPQRRCTEVSTKFQTFASQGAMSFITAGTVNRLPVLCATGASGGACSSSNILYTLKPGQSAEKIIQHLNDIRYGQSTTPLLESSGQPRNKRSVDVGAFLREAPVRPASNSSTPSPNPQPNNRGRAIW